MRNKIFGAIGILWGGAILVYGVTSGGPQGAGTYAAGQLIGFVLGGLMLASGLYTFFKSPSSSGD